MRKRLTLPGLAAAVGLIFAPVAAQAQVSTFEGSTAGCFGAGCTPEENTSINLLTFTGSTFTVDDYNMDNLTTGVGSTSNNFGLFNLTHSDNGVDNYTSPFTLMITLTSPTNASQTFEAMVTGNVVSNNSGVNVVFSSPSEWTWSEGGYNYTLGVYNTGVNADGVDAQVQGFVMATPTTTVPEPMSMVLMGTGLVGLAVVARRRRNTVEV